MKIFVYLREDNNMCKQEKEIKDILDKIKEISTVEDFFWWKNLPNRFSVENLNSEKIRKLGWDNSDVLYSFLGVYVIGVLAYYPNSFRKTNYQIKNNENEIMYSLDRLSKQFSEFTELNDNKQLIKFIKVYFSIGNTIPIWPGGNENRGKSYMFDIPDIYFNKNQIWAKILMEIYRNSFLEKVMDSKIMFDGDRQYINNPSFFNFDSTPQFLESIVNDKYSLNVRKYLYSKWVERIVGIIQDREQKLINWIMDI